MLSEATHWMLPLGEWYSLPSIILGVLILHLSLRQLNNNQNVGPLAPELSETIPFLSPQVV